MTLMRYGGQHALSPAEEEAAYAAQAAETLPLLGILRKGAPKQGNKPGKELPYFRVDWRPGYEHLDGVFHELYGPEPDRIPGLQLIGGHPFKWFYEAWNGNATLKARHNGVTFVKRWMGKDGYNFDEVPVEEDIMLAAECSPVGRLFFWLPALAAKTFEIGKFIALTTSPNDCSQLDSYIQMARRIVPIYETSFELFREPRDFTVPIKDKPSKITKYMVRVRIMPDSARAALTGPDDTHVDQVTGEIVMDELPAGDVEPAFIEMTETEGRQLGGWWRSQGLSDAVALGVLGVDRLSKWKYGIPAARQKLLDYIDAQQQASEDTSAQQQALMDVPEPVNYE